MEFVLRPVLSGSTLNGALRVHVPSKQFEVLNIRPGEICYIQTSEKKSVPGVIWQSSDPPAKANARHIKVTDIFRHAYDLRLGDAVRLSNPGLRYSAASKVSLKTLSSEPPASGKTDEDVSAHTQLLWTLIDCDAISEGLQFDVTARNGQKKRFLISNIQSSDGSEQPTLYRASDKTKLVFEDSKPAAAAPVPKGPSDWTLPAHKIRGLDAQIAQLTSLIRNTVLAKDATSAEDGRLLSGPAGTGKTLILDHIAELPWQRVLRIDNLNIPSSRAQAAVSKTFSEANENQPSLIIMDQLDHLLSSNQSESSLQDCIVDALDHRGPRVVVLAAVKDTSALSEDIRRSGRLGRELEISPPNKQARIQIVKDLYSSRFGESPDFDTVATTIGANTHGYTPADLRTLFNAAVSLASDRNNMLESDSDNKQPNSTNGEHARVTAADFTTSMREIRPSAMKGVTLEVPEVRWSQIGGCDSTRKMLTQAIEWPLKYPEVLAKLKITPTKGVLLYGPPGCAKTMTAQAVATSSGLNFLAVKGAEMLSMYVGESERALRDVFRKARAVAPAILFFDEIDGIGGSRSNGSQSSGLHVLTTLLNEMDGIEALKDVLILAATNCPETLDPALLRPGRFNKILYIGPPDRQARLEILRIATAGIFRADDFDEDAFADATEGYSGADIKNVCTEACNSAAMRTILKLKEGVEEDSTLTWADLEDALARSCSSIPAGMIERYQAWEASRKER